MDIETIIEAAKWCKVNNNCSECPVINSVDAFEDAECPFEYDKNYRNGLVDASAYYENLLIKQSEFNDRVNGQLIQDRWDERSKVIAEVKHLVENIYGDNIAVYELYEKLDSMEPDKEDKTE